MLTSLSVGTVPITGGIVEDLLAAIGGIKASDMNGEFVGGGKKALSAGGTWFTEDEVNVLDELIIESFEKLWEAVSKGENVVGTSDKFFIDN